MTHEALVLFSSTPSLRSLGPELGSLGPVDGAVLRVDDRAVTVTVHGEPWSGEALQRAVDHPWTWRESRLVAGQHRAFVSLALPAGGQPIPELLTLTRVAAALLSAPGALCSFFPAGEALRSRELVQGGLRRIGSLPAPVDLWTNTRLASLGPVWQVLDCVGMAALGLPDLEALYSTEAITWRGADAFVRNLQYYLLDGGQLTDGDHLPGPDSTDWEVRPADRSLMEPQRRVLQLAPAGGVDLPVVRL